MGQRYDALSAPLMAFIAEQKIFFVGTAAAHGHVNVSPKGMASLKVLAPSRLLWLNVTGSGNETAAHVLEDSRMTVMFCAFEGTPMILRVYGNARAIHSGDPEWSSLITAFPPQPGARQIFVLDITLVQTSCGMAVPFFDYKEERTQLRDWAIKKGDAGLRQYWAEKNQVSLDGLPTGIARKSAPQD